jgi:hypothetical protein
MIVASFMVVHLHWPKEDQLRPTPWPSFSKEHLRRLLSLARVPFPIEVSLQQSNLDSVHWHTGSSPLYILELKPWPSPAAFRSINTSWSMLSFGAFWCVQLLGNNVNLQAHGKANLVVNTNTCWMDWVEHVNALITVTISGVQLFFQFEETARKNEEVCLQIPMILGLFTWCQFSEVDCNINWVSQRRAGLRVDRSRHSTFVQVIGFPSDFAHGLQHGDSHMSADHYGCSGVLIFVDMGDRHERIVEKVQYRLTKDPGAAWSVSWIQLHVPFFTKCYQVDMIITTTPWMLHGLPWTFHGNTHTIEVALYASPGWNTFEVSAVQRNRHPGWSSFSAFMTGKLSSEACKYFTAWQFLVAA